MAGTRGEPLCILLVDDDEAVRSLTRLILEHEGWSVTEAGCRADALARAAESPVPFDVLVIDLYLPDCTGPELAADFTTANSSPVCVYTTGDPSWLNRLAQAGHTTLLKPFAPAQLAQAVRDSLVTARRTIVVAEPDAVFSRLICDAVGRVGVIAQTAAGFEHGVSLARDGRAAVLFTIAPLPGQNAIAAVEELETLRRELPSLVVICVGHDNESRAPEWCDRLLVAPFSSHNAELLLKAVLRSSSPAQ
jgi:CheY-like chemotaxis protein